VRGVYADRILFLLRSPWLLRIVDASAGQPLRQRSRSGSPLFGGRGWYNTCLITRASTLRRQPASSCSLAAGPGPPLTGFGRSERLPFLARVRPMTSRPQSLELTAHWFNKHGLAAMERSVPSVGLRTQGASPIFIVGPPRSGTTLLLQIILEAFFVSSISNRQSQLYGFPSLRRGAERNRVGVESRFTSNFGVSAGALGPSEAGNWYRRFFQETASGQEFATTRSSREFRRSLQMLTRRAGRPLILKNVFNSLRIDLISREFPDARWLWMCRNFDDNVRSILYARKAQGSIEDWFSLQPPGLSCRDLQTPVAQARAQVGEIHKHVFRGLRRARVRSDHVVRVRYEDLCRSPRNVVASIGDMLGPSVARVSDPRLPSSFSPTSASVSTDLST
jgi:hypothetical protein